ncbi:MAG: transporter [Hyphomicrobiales bacterium]|nr:transporter [Hyphomicrobiales bacterium]
MQIFSILLDVVGPVFVIALVGYLWARSGKGFDSSFVALIVNAVSTPCLVVDTLTTAGLAPAAVGQIALAAALCLTLAGLSGWALVRGLGQSVPTYLPPLIWSNGGNMGLPLCLFAFGERGLGLAIGYFVVSSVTNFTVGQAIAAGGISYRDVLRMPMTWAILVALTIMTTGLQLPVVAQRSVHLLGSITVPLMLLSLGHALASLSISSFGRSATFAAARLFGGYGIGWLVAWGMDLDAAARGVVIIQSSMPTAVLTYLFASRYNNEPQEVAGIVVISTVMSVVTLPLFFLTVM